MRWIIGDIHGMLRPLEAIVAAISNIDSSPRLIFAGDYVNRGPDSRGVIEFLLKLANARFVRGNHDDIFDLLLHNTCYVCNPTAPEQLLAFRCFVEQGLDHTLLSYGVDDAKIDQLGRRPSLDKLRKMLTAVPAAHRAFIRALVPVVEEPDFFVAHGKWSTDERTELPNLIDRLDEREELRYPLLWDRFTEPEIREPKAWNRTGYFGHTPVINYPASIAAGNVPLRGDRIVLLDTGAALGPVGRLTAFCPDTDSFIQSTPKGEIIGAA